MLCCKCACLLNNIVRSVRHFILTQLHGSYTIATHLRCFSKVRKFEDVYSTSRTLGKYLFKDLNSLWYFEFLSKQVNAWKLFAKRSGLI